MRVLKEKRILIISTEPWDHPFLSKHHLAISLAALGNQVYFLNPPSIRKECISVEGHPGLFLLNYKPFLRGIHFLPLKLIRYISKIDARAIERIASNTFDIVWIFDPFRFHEIEVFNAWRVIYHVVDVHRAKYEWRLASFAHVILGPSADLLEGFDPLKSVCIGHMISREVMDRISHTTATTSDRVRIGYAGNLLSRFLDFPLLLETVELNSQCDFIFMGDNSNIHKNPYWQKIMTFNHVSFTGPIGYKNLPEELAKFDMFWLCYDTVKYFKEASNSHKILEYLATGKPVVSTRMSSYLDEDGILYMPSVNAELPLLIKRITASLSFCSADAETAKRLNFVREHTFDFALEKIDAILATGT